MPPRTELASPKTQPPTQQKVDRLIEFSAIARKARKYEHTRRAESQWRKRVAAIACGRFTGADGFTDEAALDAYAPHGSEEIVDRHFPETAEARELSAWSRVEAAMRKGRAEYLDACGAYLRLVDAMERAEARGLTVKPLALGAIRQPSLQSLKLRPMQRRRAA